MGAISEGVPPVKLYDRARGSVDPLRGAARTLDVGGRLAPEPKCRLQGRKWEGQLINGYLMSRVY